MEVLYKKGAKYLDEIMKKKKTKLKGEEVELSKT